MSEENAWLELQSMYELGFISKAEYDRQRDVLLGDGENRC
jgi:uncharacterized protein YqgQ